MPEASNRGVSLHYETTGSGDPVVFVPDLGCGPWLWGWQVPALATGYECVVFAPRGCGQSDPGDEYAVETLAADVEAVLADAGVRTATVVGAGVGGMVALRYAREYSRAGRLVLLGTAAEGSQFDGGAVRGGLDPLLSEEFRDAYPEEVERIAGWRDEEDAAPAVKESTATAIDSFDATPWLHEVTVPVHVFHGESDVVVPAAAGEALAEGLPRGVFEGFQGGSHWWFIEQARLVNDALVGALEPEG